MRARIDPGDRKVLIVSGLVLAVVSVLGLVLRPQPSEPGGYPSSYSTASDGGKAAYLLLEELRFRVERWTQPPSDLPEDPRGTILVLADPIIPPSSEERVEISNFLRGGGRVLATGMLTGWTIPGSRISGTSEPHFEETKFKAELPGQLTRGAQEITMHTMVRWGTPRPEQRRFYGDGDGPVVVAYPAGKGEVIWWAGSTPLTNYGLTQASNLGLFLNSVELDGTAAEQTRVLWDEYFHGVRLGFWSYMGRTPAPWALAQIGLLALAALFTYGRRSGPVRPLAQESRLSPLEFIETLGALYERKGAAREALEIVYHRFRFMLLPRLGLPPSASPADVVKGVRERLGWSVPGFAETLQRCERGVRSPALRNPEAVHLIQELHDYRQRFRL